MKGKRGGPQPGSGRPKGAYSTMSFSSYTTPADKQRFVNWVLKNYTEDIALAKWLGDQMFGKARERVEVSGEMTINHLARLQAIQKKLEGHEE